MSLDLEEHLVAKANLAKIPLTANFELSPLCNLRCDMCFIRAEKAHVDQFGGLHAVEEWLDLARQLKDLGTLFILLTGGEPLLYPGFKELYAELRKMGFILTVNTNGTLITNEIINLFHQYTPRRINVTLYGSSAATYERLSHNADGYEQCMKGLRLLRENNIDTKMNISVVNQNKEDYAKLISIAQEMDIPVVANSYMFPCLRRICDTDRSVTEERLLPEDAAKATVAYLKYKHGDRFRKYAQNVIASMDVSPVKEALRLDCRAASSSCWINWQHIMTPCVMMEDPHVNLHKSNVAEAWSTIVAQSMKLPPHSECAGCHLKNLCEVCYAGASHEKQICGNLDYLCSMARKEKDLLSEYIS